MFQKIFNVSTIDSKDPRFGFLLIYSSLRNNEDKLTGSVPRLQPPPLHLECPRCCARNGLFILCVTSYVGTRAVKEPS